MQVFEFGGLGLGTANPCLVQRSTVHHFLVLSMCQALTRVGHDSRNMALVALTSHGGRAGIDKGNTICAVCQMMVSAG